MKRFLIGVLVAGGFLCCTHPEEDRPQGGDSFTALFESYSENLPLQWIPADEISVNGHIYRTGKGGRDAVFCPASEPAPESASYTGVYPAGLKLEAMVVKGNAPALLYALPDGSLPRDAYASVAESSGGNLVFKSIFSFVSLQMQTEGVKCISLTSNANEPLCGDYSADFSQNRPSVSLSGGGNKVTVFPSEGNGFAKGSRICFAIPPRTLKSGFTFSAVIEADGEEKVWEESVTDHTVFQRGGLLDLGRFTYDAASSQGYLEYASAVHVTFDCTSPLHEPVSRMLFGSFSEMHGGDLVPGVLEQYVVNTSFEPWVSSGVKGETKNELVFTGDDAVPEDPSVAYPWEKRIVEGAPSFEVTDAEKRNTMMSQKIVLGSGSEGVLLQRLALPYYRVQKYKVKFHAKVEGSAALKVSFHDVGSSEKTVLSDVYAPVMSEGEWKEYEHEFTLKSSSTLFNDRHSQYCLWFGFSGEGTVFVDHVTLFPSDCIEGIFNPETVRNFKTYGVQSIRWPGGNYTSGYNWKNGVGAWVDRPCLYNMAWGGLDSNLLGTDEFIRFCRLTGAEPVIGAGYNPSVVSEQDILDWQEYCNGDASTFWGSSRAAAGYHEPYDIKYWGIGNEVYGSYQLGHASVSSYAAGLASLGGKMKAADSDICILASGQGVHNSYRNQYTGWTPALLSGASSSFDMLDCHMYVYGNDSSGDLGLDGAGWFRVFAAAPLHLRDFLNHIRETAPGRKVAFLEWGVLPRMSGKAYETPQRQTFANLLISAGEYHEMIRQSDIVAMAAMHNFSFYVAPHKLHSEPVNMRTELFWEMSVMAGGYAVPVGHDAVPSYIQEYEVLDIGRREAVPEVDVAGVLKGNVLYISCVNRSLTEEYALAPDLEGVTVKTTSGRTYTCETPFVRNLWNAPVAMKVEPASVAGDGRVTLPPLSYTMLKVSLKNI